MSAAQGSEALGVPVPERAGAQQAAPVLAISKIGVLVLFLLAVANGVFLYFLPWLAENYYAWSIRPPINAAFLGAGYLAGAVVTGLSLFGARYWRSIRGFIPGFFLLGATLFAATLIHADRFRWDYPLTWVWTIVYALIPPAAAMIWVVQERAAGAAPARDARLSTVRLGSWVLGAVVAVVGVLLYVFPDMFLQSWPWQITPLLARAFAGWYLLVAAILLYGAAASREAREVPVPYITVVAWCVLLLLLPLLYSSSLRPDAGLLWPWVALHVVVMLFAGWAAVYAYTPARNEGQRL
ncbi:MAG TPA: hypothetical protein VFR15_13880 [Chloroflexia bacterium]|nr:hypothetical protein [Chloroflexia bacterium]